jgi:hypothetical protein
VSNAAIWALIAMLPVALAALIVYVLRRINAMFDELEAEMIACFDELDRDLQRIFERRAA